MNDMRQIHGVSKRVAGIAVFAVITIALFPVLSIAREMLPETQKIFEKYSDRVVKIQVVEKDSGAKAVIGSGFFIDPYGHIITNYHVISKLVLHHERYRAELVETAGAIRPLSILGVDVINDLALVKAEVNEAPFFRIAAREPQQGTRIYSMGFPQDISLSIVEGTYNGLMKHALYKKIHFTAPINRGMSGGPTINASGEVVGVNVSTRGLEISFLVPTEAVVKLTRSASSAKKDPQSFLDDIRRQILAHQNVFFSDDLIRSGQTVRIGDYRLPGQLSPFFKCWGDSEYPEQCPYHIVNHSCSTDDYMYISDEHSSGIIRFSHRYILNDGMNSFRFNNLYSDFFQQRNHYMASSEEEVTRFECKSGTLRLGEIIFKTAFCARGYKKLRDLYDIVLKAAVLSPDSSGLETELEISGVSFEKGTSLTKGYLEMITWEK
jgi:S1-C subfamily serine protease